MIKKLYLVFCLLMVTTSSFAAEKTKYSLSSNAVSFELLGRAGLYSLNFDTLISDSLAIGAGFSIWSVSSSSTSNSVIIVPLYGNYYFSTGNHRPYATFGLDIVTISGSINSYAFTGAGALFVGGAGYEYRGDNNFLFRLTPYLFLGMNGGVAFYGGATFGYLF